MRRTLINAAVVAGACVGAFIATTGPAHAQYGDSGRGRLLYENHCQACHTPRVHARANRIPLKLDELRQIVDGWQRQEKLNWTSDDVADVVEYLNSTIYRYQQ